MLTLLTLLCTVCCVVVFPLVPPVVPPFCLLATACSMMESKLLRKSREINTKVSTSAHKRRRKCPEDIDDPGHKKGKERERDRRHSTRSAKKKSIITGLQGARAPHLASTFAHTSSSSSSSSRPNPNSVLAIFRRKKERRKGW